MFVMLSNIANSASVYQTVTFNRRNNKLLTILTPNLLIEGTEFCNNVVIMSRFLKANISQYGHVTDVATLRCHAHVHIDMYVKLKRAGNWIARAFGFDKTS